MSACTTPLPSPSRPPSPSQHQQAPAAGDAFPVLLPSLSIDPRDKEIAEFRSLLQTVFSCLKSVLYCLVAFHTNRGLQAPVRRLCLRSLLLCVALDSALPHRPACLLLLGHGRLAPPCLLLLHAPTLHHKQMSFPVKTWSVRAGDVRAVSRIITFGLPALAFYEAMPHPSVDMRDQFADFFNVLQVKRGLEGLLPTVAVFGLAWGCHGLPRLVVLAACLCGAETPGMLPPRCPCSNIAGRPRLCRRRLSPMLDAPTKPHRSCTARVLPTRCRTAATLPTWSRPSWPSCLTRPRATATTCACCSTWWRATRVRGECWLRVCYWRGERVFSTAEGELRRRRRLTSWRLTPSPPRPLPFLAASRSGVNRYMIALLLQFIVKEKKLEAVHVSHELAPAGQQRCRPALLALFLEAGTCRRLPRLESLLPTRIPCKPSLPRPAL